MTFGPGEAPLPLLTEIGRIQELIYEMTVKQVMSRNIITVGPDTKISELKEVLRINRISGTPVLEEGRLVGVISLEDLIKALEAGAINQPVRERMTTKMITVHAEESVIEAVKKFAKYEVGRLPVIDENGNLAGILTSGDITRGVLEAVGLNEQQADGRRLRKRQLFENIVSDQTSLTLKYIIKSQDFKRGGHASSRLKLTLGRMGVPKPVLRRVAIASYEAEMNLIIHTQHGGELVATIQPDAVQINTIDDGPGIPDVQKAMQPGFSTAPHWIHELGFGAGMGLMNIKRCADEMKLESEVGVGTRMTITISLRPPAADAGKPDQAENKAAS